jgi:hypothetical protein
MAKRHLVGLAGLVEVAPKSTGLTALDFLRFHYYAGLVWGGLKAWPEAVESFKLAVTMPSEAVSTVSVEAYKKLVLSSLICKGKKPVLPPYTATPVVRCLKLAARVYDNLAARFEEDDPAGLEAEVAKEYELLEKDKNVGLAKQVRATPHVYFLPCFVGCLVLSNLCVMFSRCSIFYFTGDCRSQAPASAAFDLLLHHAEPGRHRGKSRA